MPTTKSTPKKPKPALEKKVLAELAEKCRVEIIQCRVAADFYDHSSDSGGDEKLASEYRLKAQQRRDTLAFNERFLAYIETL